MSNNETDADLNSPEIKVDNYIDQIIPETVDSFASSKQHLEAIIQSCKNFYSNPTMTTEDYRKASQDIYANVNQALHILVKKVDHSSTLFLQLWETQSLLVESHHSKASILSNIANDISEINARMELNDFQRGISEDKISKIVRIKVEPPKFPEFKLRAGENNCSDLQSLPTNNLISKTKTDDAKGSNNNLSKLAQSESKSNLKSMFSSAFLSKKESSKNLAREESGILSSLPTDMKSKSKSNIDLFASSGKEEETPVKEEPQIINSPANDISSPPPLPGSTATPVMNNLDIGLIEKSKRMSKQLPSPKDIPPPPLILPNMINAKKQTPGNIAVPPPPLPQSLGGNNNVGSESKNIPVLSPPAHINLPSVDKKLVLNKKDAFTPPTISAAIFSSLPPPIAKGAKSAQSKTTENPISGNDARSGTDQKLLSEIVQNVNAQRYGNIKQGEENSKRGDSEVFSSSPAKQTSQAFANLPKVIQPSSLKPGSLPQPINSSVISPPPPPPLAPGTMTTGVPPPPLPSSSSVPSKGPSVLPSVRPMNLPPQTISSINNNNNQTKHNEETKNEILQVNQQLTKSNIQAKSDKEFMRVKYGYVAADSDELTVDEGDILEILEKSAGNGWTRVMKDDTKEEGLVPFSFLEDI